MYDFSENALIFLSGEQALSENQISTAVVSKNPSHVLFNLSDEVHNNAHFIVIKH